MDFKEFYQQCGLKEYPFNTFTTEDEAKANELFVEPVDYTLIKDGYKNQRTIIMSGNRGTGKTAIVYDLIRNSPNDTLICYIDDYSSINTKSTLQEFYELIAKSLVNTLFEKSLNRQRHLKKLSKEDKIFFSFLVDKFVTPITKQLVFEKIEQIQLGKLKCFFNKSSSFIQFFINYGLTAAIKMLNNTIAVHFYMLPPVNEDEIKTILPSIKFTPDNHFIDEETSYSFILKICQLINKLGFSNTITFLDKIDEDTRFENDSDIIADFVKPLLTDNKLLLNPNIQLVTSIWAVPFSNIKANVRTQKYYCPELIWQQRDLISAFNQRLKVFGANSYLNFDSLFSVDVTDNQKEEVIKLANHNPRDLWHIYNNLFHQQFIINETAKTISSSAVLNGLNEFVKTFNYFEYYPRKKGARSSSMDIYKYINHLLKLSSFDFTSNQLNEVGVGSSTNNYIAGMQSIGLIRRTDIKRNNGVVYEIIDPKVIYAMEKQIKISR
ncbi:P-loop ATPase, Sll1717 family [Enterocloster bolteae]|uniref:P-loop ATPase, Sll1717 family n=1 Tax=Enterocloster bolteae TaxID=208479 RepID=UPI002109D666|nr:hypothetical protein [Enterocloster bolteae]MCQ4758995.1 hypothetical protein [Enterocloster bolteae]